MKELLCPKGSITIVSHQWSEIYAGPNPSSCEYTPFVAQVMRELLNGSKDRTKIHTTPVCGRGSSRYLSWEIPLPVPFFFVDSPFHLSYAEPLKHHVQRRNKRQSGKTCVLLSTVTCLFSVFFTRASFRLRLSRATRIGWKLHPEGPINRSYSGEPPIWKKANGRL